MTGRIVRSPRRRASLARKNLFEDRHRALLAISGVGASLVLVHGEAQRRNHHTSRTTTARSGWPGSTLPKGCSPALDGGFPTALIRDPPGCTRDSQQTSWVSHITQGRER